MSRDSIKEWLEIVGMIAIVGSLIFVGLQMRQAQEISMSQAYQSRTAAVVEWNTAFAANPAALSAYRKAADDAADDITAGEYEALSRTLAGLFFLFDNAYYQYRNGFVSEEFWGMTRASLKNQMRNPATRAVFLERVESGVRPEFGEIVLQVSQELAAQPDK